MNFYRDGNSYVITSCWEDYDRHYCSLKRTFYNFCHKLCDERGSCMTCLVRELRFDSSRDKSFSIKSGTFIYLSKETEI